MSKGNGDSMSKSMLIVLAAASIAVSQSYYESLTSIKNTIYGGVAFAIEQGAGMNPGVNAGIEPIKKINTYLGVGGHIDYTWLSVKNLPSNVGEGVHLFDVSFVPKAFVPVGKDMDFTFEIDPGIYGIDVYYRLGGFSSSEFNLHFGLTTGAGFKADVFSFLFKFKTFFTESDGYHYMRLVNWLALCAGVEL